jgi:hypothetical protein
MVSGMPQMCCAIVIEVTLLHRRGKGGKGGIALPQAARQACQGLARGRGAQAGSWSVRNKPFTAEYEGCS